MDTAEHPLELEALAEQPVLPSRYGRVLLLALGAGLLAEVAIHPVVFDRAKPGIGLTVFILIPIIVLLNGRWVIGTGPSSESIVLLLSAGFLAVMITVRASSVLTTWNLMGIAVLLPLAAFSYRGGLAGSSLTQFAAAGLRAGISAPVQTVYLIRDDAPDDWRERMSRSIWQSRSLLRGLAIAALLLLIFGTLLASADAVFANLVEAVFGWDLDAGLVVGSAAVVLTTAWLIAGALRFAAGRQTPREWDRRVGFLSKTEVVTAVAPLVVLFAVFVPVRPVRIATRVAPLASVTMRVLDGL